jgi:hypothetical protein
MGELGLNFKVYRNDELTVEDIERYKFFLSLSLNIFTNQSIIPYLFRKFIKNTSHHFRMNASGILISPGPGQLVVFF